MALRQNRKREGQQMQEQRRPLHWHRDRHHRERSLDQRKKQLQLYSLLQYRLRILPSRRFHSWQNTRGRRERKNNNEKQTTGLLLDSGWIPRGGTKKNTNSFSCVLESRKVAIVDDRETRKRTTTSSFCFPTFVISLATRMYLFSLTPPPPPPPLHLLLSKFFSTSNGGDSNPRC